MNTDSVDSGAVVFGYDNNGNRMSRVEGGDTTGYDYDVENRLVTVTLDDLSTVTMGYDAAGARVWRAHGTDRTRYIAGMVEQDLDTGATSGWRSLYGFAGTPVAVVDHTASTVVYPVGDHLGSIVAAYNDTTNTAATMRYDPWGAQRSATGALPTDHRYTGQTSDATSAASAGTGLLFYNARHYDPTIGAFTQADTIIPNPTTPASFNRYAYVTNNPVNHTDPSGHCPEAAYGVTCHDRGNAAALLEFIASAAKTAATDVNDPLKAWWYFSEGGPGDIKHEIRRATGTYMPVTSDAGIEIRWDLSGNITFGYAMAEMGLGWAAPTLGEYFGGEWDLGDGIAVEIGVALWRDKGWDATLSDLERLILARRSDLLIASDVMYDTGEALGPARPLPRRDRPYYRNHTPIGLPHEAKTV